MENLPSNRSHQSFDLGRRWTTQKLFAPLHHFAKWNTLLGLWDSEEEVTSVAARTGPGAPFPCEVGAPCWRDGMGIAALPRTQLPVTKTDNVLSNAPTSATRLD